MQADEFLLPLLGGYLFLNLFRVTRYRISSLSGYVVILEAAVAGVFLLAAAAIVVLFFKRQSDGILMHAFLLTAFIIALVNLLYGSYMTAWRAARRWPKYVTEDQLRSMPESLKASIKKAQNKELLIGIAGVIFCLLMIFAVCIHSFDFQFLPFIVSTLLLTVILLPLEILAMRHTANYSDFPTYVTSRRIGFAIFVAVIAFSVAYAMIEEISDLWSDLWKGFNNPPRSVFPIALILGGVFAALGNIVVDRWMAIERLIRKGFVNSLEMELYRAGPKLQPMMITMTDEKVYVGFIDNENPIEGKSDEFVIIVPVFSGYRKRKTLELELTTNYTSVFNEAVERSTSESTSPAELKSLLRPLRKVLPIDKIISAGPFKHDAWTKFQSRDE